MSDNLAISRTLSLGNGCDIIGSMTEHLVSVTRIAGPNTTFVARVFRCTHHISLRAVIDRGSSHTIRAGSSWGG